MLRNAPKFYEVAKRIVEITQDCILVAHNADFDYRILKTEFQRLGFSFERKTLCTVELSQELIPNQDSYSLGKLTRSLGIPVSERHRANGDAMATVKLFKLLLAKDTGKTIIQDSVKEHASKNLNKNHIDIVESLPAVTGVYYMHDQYGKIFFIGKSKNIKQRVNQHLTNTNRKSKKIQLLVKSVSYEPTGSELVALLKENEEIKRTNPKLNRRPKHKKFSHGIYSFKDDGGYINLRILNISKRDDTPITTFANFHSAKSYMVKMANEYELCFKLIGLSKSNCALDKDSILKCKGACSRSENYEDYNKKVLNFISQNSYSEQNIAIVDKGRRIDERSVIYIKDGHFQGLGFTELNYQINNKAILESIITPMDNNQDTKHIIHRYLRKSNRVKLIPIK